MAQFTLFHQNATRNSVVTSNTFPSTIKYKGRWQLGFGANAWGFQRLVSLNQIRKILKGGTFSENELKSTLNHLNTNNTIEAGAEVSVFSLSRKIKVKNEEWCLNFLIAEKVDTKINFSKNLPLLIFGNKQFEGEKIDLTNTSVNALYYRSFKLGISGTIYKNSDIEARIGTYLNYYMAFAAIRAQNNGLFLSTGSGGESLALDYSYKVNMAGFKKISFLKPSGNGLGTSNSISIIYKDKYELDIGLSDLGSIYFNKQTSGISDGESILFEGVALSAYQSLQHVKDSIVNKLKYQTSQNKPFFKNTSPRFNIQKTYNYNLNSRVFKAGYIYLTASHAFLRKAPNLSNYFGIGFKQQFFNFLDAGTQLSWSTQAPVNIGSFLKWSITPNFNLAIASGNLRSFLRHKTASDFDLSFALYSVIK
jgi:hypothetical protein